MRRRNWTVPYALFLIIFVVMPLLLIVIYAFTDAEGAFTFANFRKFMMHPESINTFVYSIGIAVITTLVCLLLGYPAAYILSQKRFNTSQTMVVLFILPMWVNFILRIMAWQLLLSRNGLINGALGAIGLPGQDLANSSMAIVIGMVYDYLPFMILPVYNAVTDLKDDVIEAARDLGAPPKAVLTRIMIPLTKPGIISGITMVFVPSLTAFAIPDILGGGKVMLIGNIIEQEFSTSMNWHLGSGLSIALMIFVLISMIFTSNEE